MARFVARPGLDAYMARTVGAKTVNRLKVEVREGARRRAPDGKAWRSAKDTFVRPAHVDAEGQEIPENLRYQLRKMIYVRKGRDPKTGKAANPEGGWKVSAGFDLARRPRDPSLPDEQKINCRCESKVLPGAVARSIRAAGTRQEGTRVVADVETRYPRAAESEFGTEGDKPALFMTGSVREARARLRAG